MISSFYAGIDYLRGFNRSYESKNAAGMETGFRWVAWKGLNFRLGAIAIASKGQSLKINPAPRGQLRYFHSFQRPRYKSSRGGGF